MARKQSRVPIPVSPPMADDFQLITGIGPALARRLHDAGIYTYNQLASQSPAELAARLILVSSKQIARQGWIRQARKLVPKKTRPKTHKKETVIPTNRQHYANFTIEFLLDEKNAMRRTRVVHIQSGDADAWAGWEAEQLVDFLARHTEVNTPQAKLALQETEVARSKTLQSTNGESKPKVIRTPDPLPVFSDVSKLAQPSTEIAKPVSQFPAANNIVGTLRLCDLKVVPVDSDLPIFSLRQGQSYRLRLTLDLSEVVVPTNILLIYKATIIFKHLGGPRYSVSEASSTLKLSNQATLGIAGTSLPSGIYRLDAFVRLTSDEAALGLTAFLKGELLQVY